MGKRTEQDGVDKVERALDRGWHYIVVDNPNGKREMLATSCALVEFLAELAGLVSDHWVHSAVTAELAKDKPVGGVIALQPG